MKKWFSLFAFYGLSVSCHFTSNAGKPAIHDTTRNKPAETTNLPDTALRALKRAGIVSIQELLSQRWELEDADRRHWDGLLWDSELHKRKYPSICLFRDNAFTQNARCGIRMGSWKLNTTSRILELDYKEGTPERYVIRDVSLKMIEAVLEDGMDSIQIRLQSDGIVHKRAAEDPFYPSNNSWRIKPQAPESPSQIRSRLKACVHFYALFFKDNFQRRASDISFIGLPSCFVWYNGGIGLTPMIELDRKWKECFYSEDQAVSAYGMLNDVMQKHNLKWPKHADSWIEETQAVLVQIENQL